MFGNKGIFGEDLSVGRAQNAEFDAFSTNRKLAASRNNASEWEAYAKKLEECLRLERESLKSNKAYLSLLEECLSLARSTFVDVTLPTMTALRATIRELLVELKKSDPKNPLLNKVFRDSLFDASYNAQNKLHEGKDYHTIEYLLPRFMDVAYNVKDSSKGGPELKDITSNIEVRRVAGIPDHTPEIGQHEANETGLTISIAGFRGVTRELLSELRKADPKNPLLDKNIRDRVFDVTSADGIKYPLITRANEEKSGPEKQNITSKQRVRAESKIPDHQSDRDKFLALIGKLSRELLEVNPESSALKDETMVEIFDEFALNEMVKQDGVKI